MTVYVVLNSYTNNMPYDMNNSANNVFKGVFSSVEKAKEFIFATYKEIPEDEYHIKTKIKADENDNFKKDMPNWYAHYRFKWEDDYGEMIDDSYTIYQCDLDVITDHMKFFF